MAKVHLHVHVDFVNLCLLMACGEKVGPEYDVGSPLLYTNSEDLMLKHGEKWACKRCLAALRKEK